MPPKIKTGRETIIHAAFEVAQSGGVSEITAQSVAVALKTSVAPIFREFQTIEELRISTVQKINLFHAHFIKNYPPVNSEFLTYGIACLTYKVSLDITEEEEEKLLMAAFSAFYKSISKVELEDGTKNNETI